MMFPDPFFTAVFIIVLIMVIISFIVGIFRFFRSGGNNMVEPESYQQPVVREREIIREIVKIRCAYCGNTYDEKEDVCPYCGGKKT
jgi:hypothetical protein